MLNIKTIILYPIVPEEDFIKWKTKFCQLKQIIAKEVDFLPRKAKFRSLCPQNVNLPKCPELEFLNKMQNPGILESRDLRWGGIQRKLFLPN
jgi:hypothetical protein